MSLYLEQDGRKLAMRSVPTRCLVMAAVSSIMLALPLVVLAPTSRATMAALQVSDLPPEDSGGDDEGEDVDDIDGPPLDPEHAGVHHAALVALSEGFPGVLEGTGCRDGTGLCPNKSIRRWEVAVWMVRAFDGIEPPPKAASRFADVTSGEWWLAHADRLADLGITRGCATEPLRFCPNGAVTRSQMASFLVRAFGYPPVSSAGFQDIRGSVHAADINSIAAARVTVGCATDPPRFCPKEDVTRGEMASFLARALELVKAP